VLSPHHHSLSEIEHQALWPSGQTCYLPVEIELIKVVVPAFDMAMIITE
jgi:hypothetical protein